MSLNNSAAHNNAWQTLSVHDFFAQLPWTGEPMSSPSASIGPVMASGDVGNLHLHLSVGEFFWRFPWDGKPNIAAPIAPIAPIEIQPDLPAEDSMTLDGFADLF